MVSRKVAALVLARFFHRLHEADDIVVIEMGEN